MHDHRGILHGARSDAIQAGIMLCAYLLMPFVLLSHYPSMNELYRPCGDNSTQCIAAVRPWFALYPTVGGSCLPVNNVTDPDCYRSHYVRVVCNYLPSGLLQCVCHVYACNWEYVTVKIYTITTLLCVSQEKMKKITHFSLFVLNTPRSWTQVMNHDVWVLLNFCAGKCFSIC